jgi:hypothetical protein
MRIGSGPASSIVPSSGFSTATAANRAAGVVFVVWLYYWNLLTFGLRGLL